MREIETLLKGEHLILYRRIIMETGKTDMKRNSGIAISLLLALALFCFAGAATIVEAQEQEQPSPAEQQALPADQLDNLVAPIALYPDPLLGQMLVASTYPLEVVEASQWLERNRNLHGQALADAAKQEPWDPSIQALVVVPDALAKLNQDIQWTTDLGNAFLSQQADVMNAIQRMRSRAEADGRLSSTPQQTVTTDEQGGERVIVIQPANPEVIYVPVYDPLYIWGPPLYGYYPPLYYPLFGFNFGIGCDIGFYFGGWGGWGYWGWSPAWYSHAIYVNNSFFNRYGYRRYWAGGSRGRAIWVHNPAHRLRVPYRNARTAARVGGRSIAPRNSYRSETGQRSAVSSQARRSQNPPRQQYMRSQQYQSSFRQQTQRTESRVRPTYRAPQEYRPSTQQRYQSMQQYRSTPQINTRVQRFQSPGRIQVPRQQYRSAPRTSAPRSGGSSRGGGGHRR
jgi:hypothetical protein